MPILAMPDNQEDLRAQLDHELLSGQESPDKPFSPFGCVRDELKLKVKTQPTSGVSSYETTNTLEAVGTPLFVSKDTYRENGIAQIPTPTYNGSKSLDVKNIDFTQVGKIGPRNQFSFRNVLPGGEEGRPIPTTPLRFNS